MTEDTRTINIKLVPEPSPFAGQPDMDPEFPVLKHEGAVCVAVCGDKNEAKRWLWTLATFGVPTLLLRQGKGAYHVAVPAALALTPVVWMASFREDTLVQCDGPVHSKHPAPVKKED